MSTSKFDLLKSLEVFVCVAETGSMTAAAHLLKVTQAAVSHHVKQLEAHLQKSLVDRSVRPVRLTTAGFVLRKKAVEILETANEIRTEIRHIGSEPLNGIRLAVIGSLAGTLVPLLVTALIDELQVRNVTVRRGFGTAQTNALVRREADLLITSDAMFEIAHLQRLPLYSEPFILVVPVDPALRTMSLQKLAQRLPFIRYTGRFVTGRVIEAHLRRLRLELPDILEFDSSQDVIAMIAANRGWAISTPSHVLHGLRPTERVRLLPMPGPGFRRVISLLARENELGAVPQRVAEVARQVIQSKFIPQLHRLAPWLVGQVTVIDSLTR